MTERRLPFRGHIAELRRRLTWSAIVVVACTGAAFAFHQQILTLLMEPAGGFAGIPNQKPIFTGLTEYVGTAMKVSLLVGLAASLPFVLLQAVLFVAPGLTAKERPYLFVLMPAVLLAFLAGAAFGYKVLFPPAIRFLLSFGSDVATPYIRIGSYVDLMVNLLFWMGVLFETPVVLFLLSRLGLVSSEFLARHRRAAVVIAFVLGGIITPTFDPINQTLVAGPVIVLYELSIWLTRIGRRRRRPSVSLETDGTG